MGLLGIVAAQARRVDLLPKLIRLLPVLSLLCILAGAGNLAVLPVVGQYRNTYFSENALLTHQAITFFRESDWDVVRGFKGQVRDYFDKNVPEAERNAELVELFHSFGLQAYTHDWHTQDGQSGQNLYAINMASRGPHNEAIVIAAPWLIQQDFNEGGTALLISLARFFQRWNFWHKNLIFVLPSNSDVALRSFVDAYYSSLQYTAGSIEGAIVLDYSFSGEFFESIDVDFEGLNGQLPNLDLVNSGIHSVMSEFTKPRTLGIDDPGDGQEGTYSDRALSIGRHIWQQMLAGVRPSRCASAMFSGWRIDAITLRAVEGNAWYDITTLGRVCESTVRSINNLHEHFHQSFFFYLMLAPRRFVSIASYLPTGMLVAASFSVMGLYRFVVATNVTASAVWRTVVILVGLLLICGAGVYAPSAGSAALFLGGVGVVSLSLSALLTVTEKSVLNAMALGLIGLELVTLSMVNFSLALGMGLACVPLAWVRPGGNKILNFLLSSLGPATVLSILAAQMDTTFMDLLAKLVWSGRELHVRIWGLVAAVWVPLWAACLACT